VYLLIVIILIFFIIFISDVYPDTLLQDEEHSSGANLREDDDFSILAVPGAFLPCHSCFSIAVLHGTGLTPKKGKPWAFLPTRALGCSGSF